MSAYSPGISVVIPVYNCRETADRCMASLARLDYPDYEVIVVDDGSTDGTAEICESYAGARIIRLDKGGPSRARNEGIKAARGEVIAFTDGDCVVDRPWLRELAGGFTGPDVAGVGGDQVSPDDDTDVGKMVQEFFKTIGFVTGYIKTGATIKDTDHNPSCNSAYRKEILEKVGGFNEDLWPGEDVELDLNIRRLGYRLIFNPGAVVAHYRPRTYLGFARMMRRYGACQWPLVRKYGPFRKLHLVPPAMVLILGAFGLLAAWRPAAMLLVLAGPAALFLWFYLRTLELRKSCRFTLLMLITLISWNRGFFGAMVEGAPG